MSYLDDFGRGMKEAGRGMFTILCCIVVIILFLSFAELSDGAMKIAIYVLMIPAVAGTWKYLKP
jgi:hypothetical protein